MKQIKCPNCGANMKRSPYYCEYCGSTFVEEKKDSYTPKTENPPPVSAQKDNEFTAAAPSFDKIFSLSQKQENNSEESVSDSGNTKWIIIALVLSIIGFISSFAEEDAWTSGLVFFIISLIFVKKQNKICKTKLSKFVKIFTIISIVLWLIISATM